MKKWLAFILLMTTCFILTGCWNYREIESLSIVAGVGIERDPVSGDFILYIEIIEPSGNTKEQAPASKVVESRGKTIFEAVRDVIDTSGKRMFWNHSEVIIISEAVAREGILDVIDWFYRDAEPRLTLYLAVAYDASVKDIMASNGITSKVRSFEISDKIENVNSIEKYPKVELYKIVEMLKFDVPYAYVPSITLKKQDDMEVSEIFGTAIFKGDKLKGFLDQEDTKYFLYIKNEIKGGLLVNKDIQGNPDANISLEIFNNKTTVKPVYSDGKITMAIHVKSETAIGEAGPDVDYIDKSGMTALIEDMQEFLEENMLRVIQKVQNEFDTDIFGFGQIICEDMPDVWEQYKNNWDVEFKELEFNITSKIKIRHSGHSQKSLREAK